MDRVERRSDADGERCARVEGAFCVALPALLFLWAAALDVKVLSLADWIERAYAVREPDLVEPVLAIYEAAAGASLKDRPYFSVTNCTVAPLRCTPSVIGLPSPAFI